MFKDRGFYFHTKKGTVYYYNDRDGTVQIAERVKKEEHTIETSSSCEKDLPDIETSDIQGYLKSEGYRQLTLITTQDCNLRCLYCVYSGNYSNMRTHQTSYMTPDVAREAIKRYFEGFVHVKRRNPYRIPAIGFYGGEPLRNFDLICQAVEFAKGLYPGRILFNLTTNGTILTDKMIQFFHDNDFALAISLNGPQTEHDRLRIFPGGTGTFSIVWDNLQKIREKYPNYYREKCSVLVCYDVGTDLKTVTNFFEINGDVLPPIGRVSLVSPRFTDWYDRYSTQQKVNFVHLQEACRERYFTQLVNGEKVFIVLEALFGMAYQMAMNRPQNIPFRPHYLYLPYTGTCIPGDKIAVDPQGDFHCCERINEQFPTGDIETGVDIEKIVTLIDLYRRQIYPECFDCPITRLCSVCYATVAGNGKFERNPSDLCTIIRKDIKVRFEMLWSLFEAGVKESDILKISDPFPDF
ncbi:MAG: radical SAM protein [Candidatus Bipolaricaulia bacterium]